MSHLRSIVISATTVIFVAWTASGARADDGDDIERFREDVRRLDERRARDLEERDRALAEAGSTRDRLGRLQAADEELARESEEIRGEIDRGETLPEAIRRNVAEIVTTHRRYTADPKNELLYQELQRLRTLQEGLEREAAAFARRRPELRSRLEDVGRGREELGRRIASERQDLETALARYQRAQEAFEASDRDLTDFVRSDPDLTEFFEATKRFEPAALELFDGIMDQFGPQDTGTCRTVELAIEGEVEASLYKALKLKGGGKYRALLTRDESGDFELTVIGEGSAGVGLGNSLAGVEAGLVVRSRNVYHFDREQTGEMLALGTLLGTAGMPLAEALRYVDDDVWKFGVGAAATLAKGGMAGVEWTASGMADLAEWVDWDGGADALRTVESGADGAGAGADDARDLALGIKYAASMQPPSDQMTKTVLEGGLRGRAQIKAFRFAKGEGEIEAAIGTETRREGRALRDVDVYSFQSKTSAQARAGVALQTDESTKTVLKYVKDQDGRIVRAEVLFKEARENGLGVGAGVDGFALSGALGARTLHEIQVKDPTPDEIAYLEGVLTTNAGGLWDPEGTREELRRGFLLSRNPDGEVVHGNDRFSEVMRRSDTSAAELSVGKDIVGQKLKLKGTRIDTRSTVLSGDPELEANTHELGDDHDGS